MNSDPARIPVIIGVGQINDRDNVHDALGLMIAAMDAADADAGGGWIPRLDSIAVVNQISFPKLGNCAQHLAQHFGISPKIVEQTPYPTGESPVQLLNDAANRIGAGDIGVAMIVGAEALRTAAERARAATGEKKDALRDVASGGAKSVMHLHGLVAPTDLYPLYENATRAAWGQSLAEAQAESGEIWAGMSAVAAGNDHAWIRTALSADQITSADADNRPIAFPYQKRMVANSSVNQGAGFIVTSLALARAAGVPEARIIHVGMGAAAHETHNMLKRDQYVEPAGMVVTIEETLKRNHLSVAQIDHVELYSCFPCVPKMARRILGWPVNKPITAFGGLTFGGGPIGNYMSHAIASMVDALRDKRGTALLFANGGYATHFHGIVLSADPLPEAHFPHDYDVNALADARRGPVPDTDEGYEGVATIESYTVFYNRDASVRFGTIIARTPQNARVLARVDAEDAGMIAMLTDGRIEPVGQTGQTTKGDDGLIHWRAA
ncbi:MAG: acetyl-CoA acetyltransferase [Chakrabartia sp.]